VSLAGLSSDGDQPPTARLRESPAWLSTRYIRLDQSRCKAKCRSGRGSLRI